MGILLQLQLISVPGNSSLQAVRLIFNLPKDMASVDVLQRAQWPTRSIYYKLAIFICFHKAFHDRLPVTLIDLIFKKQATNYPTRTRTSLIVPRFNTRYMKDSVTFRGSILWNAVTNNCRALTKNVPYRDLRQRLHPLVILENMTLYILKNLCSQFLICKYR